MKRVTLVLALFATSPVIAMSAAEKSYFQRSAVFTFVGEDEALGTKVSVFISKSVQSGETERRASVAWAFRESVNPLPHIRIDSTEWSVTADCEAQVIAFERFEDGDSFARIRRAGAGAFWARPEAEGLPRILLADVFRSICGTTSPSAQISILALGSNEPPPAMFVSPERRESRRHSDSINPRGNLPEPPSKSSTGTGFYVSPTTIVTNHHVVAGCSSVTVKQPNGISTIGQVVDASQTLDLAQINVHAPNASALLIRGESIEVGEAVVTFGFPLSGILAEGGVATTGIVSALAGIREDATRIQITAPIQPGNSGGPVLDDRGQVVGVVVSKLNALRIAESIGDVPQNVNFAVNLQSLKTFLSGTVEMSPVRRHASVRTTKDVVRMARAGSVMITCTRQ